MKEYKNFLTPIDKLKQEIEIRYNMACYRKLHHNYLCNRIEKNNFNIMFKAAQDLSIDWGKKGYKKDQYPRHIHVPFPTLPIQKLEFKLFSRK